MNLKCILWILLLFINHVVGEFLEMSFSSVNMSRVIRSISGITITACHMECGKEPACHDIAISERTPDNHLPTCYLLKEDNGHYDEGKNVLTTIQAIGSGVRVVNVASGKKATQSSTWKAEYSPSNAVDGDTSLSKRAVTKKEFKPWWEVDLGDVKVIKEIRLNVEVDNHVNNGLLVETQRCKGESWAICKNIGDLINPITKFQCHDKTTKARFLRIRSTETCLLSLYEVEILGY